MDFGLPFPSKAESHGTSKACAFGPARLLARMAFPDFLLLVSSRLTKLPMEIYKTLTVGLENGRCERI